MKKNANANVATSADDKKWDDIRATYGDEVEKALRALYDYYDGPGIAEWIASLYDPKTGGFYYCKSARDTEGYLPDLESTQQALSVLAEVGAVPGEKLNEMLPQKIKAKIVDFVRDRQSPVDGYFYHPQWPQGKENLNTDRYGRDIGNAGSVFRRVQCDRTGSGIDEQQYPKYCMVNGRKCACHEGTNDSCTFPIGDFPAVSAPASNEHPEAKKSTENHPDYTSESAFLAWLDVYNATIHTNSGRAHNLAALIEEIRAHGYENVLIDYLNEKQKELFDEQVRLGEAPTGIWQRNIDYKAVWGTYKYLYIYNLVGRAIDLKYVPYMVDSCIAVINLPPLKNYAYNDLMNQWQAITGIITNVRKHYGDEEADKIHARVRENAAHLVANSLEKMLPFKMDDGSFCNSVKGVTTNIIYGVPIAVGGLAEGNVNSTHILLCMYFAICRVLGCPAIPLTDVSVGMAAVKAMEAAELNYQKNNCANA